MMADKSQAICGGFFLPLVRARSAMRARTAAKIAAVTGWVIWAASWRALVNMLVLLILQIGQVLSNDFRCGVVGAEGVLVDGEGATEERLRMGKVTFGPQQRCQIVEYYGQIRVVGAEGIFVDGEYTSEERLRMGKVTFGPQQRCQIVEKGSDNRGVGAEGVFVNG